MVINDRLKSAVSLISSLPFMTFQKHKLPFSKQEHREQTGNFLQKEGTPCFNSAEAGLVFELLLYLPWPT